MAGELLLNKGTSLTIGGGGTPNYAFSVQGLANGSGYVSAQIDLGALPRADEYEWYCELQFQATPTQGLGLELYKASAPDSDNTQIDGDIGTANAALGDIDMRRNLRQIGYVVSENAAASEKCNASGTFRHTGRYLSIVAFNASGATVNATASNFKFILRPIYYQGQ